MSKRMFGVAVVMLACLVSSSVARATTVVSGGSVLTDFEMVDRWQVQTGRRRNLPGLAYVPEGDGSLYAACRDSAPAPDAYVLRKLPLWTPQAGVTQVVPTGSRTDRSAYNYSGVAYDPVYNQGTVLLMRGIYFPGSAGFVGGTDGICITAEGDGSDIVIDMAAGSATTNRYNEEVCYVPGKYTWTNQDGFFHTCRGTANVRQYEVDTTPDPDVLTPSVLPGRAAGEYTQSVVFSYADLGLTAGIRGVEFIEYANGQGVLYCTVPTSGTDYGFVAVTPGADGKFGANGAGVNDDEAFGYFFGDVGEGNTYSIMRQNITSEAGGGGNPTDELNIHGSYNTGFVSIAIDPTTGLIYIHGGGDYATGVVLRDTSFRVAPPAPIAEPAGLSLLGLALLGLRRRRS